MDDRMLYEIAEWVLTIEKSHQFNRFVDFGQLTEVAVRTRHVFDHAQKRAKQFAGVKPARTGLFCEDWVGFGIALLYESLMKNTPI